MTALHLDLDYLKPILHRLEKQLPPLLGEKSAVILSARTSNFRIMPDLMEKWSYSKVASLPASVVYARGC